MRNRCQLLAMLAASALFAPWVVHADEKKENTDHSAVGCINYRNIDRTDIIDGRTIVFFMRNKKQIYVNNLPSTCANLVREDRFGYNIKVGSQLCKTDVLEVPPQLVAHVGVPSYCRLGEFVPASAEEIAELRTIRDKGRKGDAIDVKPVAPPKENPAASDAAPNGGEPAR